jgi:hypothetical protein
MDPWNAIFMYVCKATVDALTAVTENMAIICDVTTDSLTCANTSEELEGEQVPVNHWHLFTKLDGSNLQI